MIKTRETFLEKISVRYLKKQLKISYKKLDFSHFTRTNEIAPLFPEIAKAKLVAIYLQTPGNLEVIFNKLKRVSSFDTPPGVPEK